MSVEKVNKQDLESAASYVVKVTRTDEEQVRDAECKEYDLLKEIDHRNVVKAIDFYPDEHLGPHLVLEYVDGEELLKYIAKLPKEAYTEQLARGLFRQVLEALAHLHVLKDGKRIVHRDVKPDNLLVESVNQRVVLIDFNVSRKYNPDEDTMIDVTGVVQYTAPEMYEQGGSGYDEKVDVWSAGVVLYLMLTGRQPFTGSDEEIVANI